MNSQRRAKMGPSIILSIAGIASCYAACYTGPQIIDIYAPGKVQIASNTAATLPCDVADVLSACNACHSSPPHGAPNSLTTHDELTAKSRTDPSKTVAQISVERMQDAANPMPPTGVAGKADIDILNAWIAADYPTGECGGGPSTNVFAGTSTCTSGTNWTRGENIDMRPGEACNACHVRQAPDKVMAFGGTVYPTGHEPNDCNGIGGVASGTVVIVKDATGKEVSIPVRASGNFSLARANGLTAPYAVRVESNGKSRRMSTAVTAKDGDCNGCHTDSGTKGAPGRIAAP
jgi:cytochrome c5